MTPSEQLRGLIRARLASRKRGRLKRPMVWLYPIPQERKLQSLVSGTVSRLSSVTRRFLSTRYEGWLRAAGRRDSAEVRADAQMFEDIGTLNRELADAQKELFEGTKGTTLTTSIFKVGKDIGNFNRNQWNKMVEVALGQPLIGAEPWLTQRIDQWAAKNMTLVKSLSTEYIGKMNVMVAEGVKKGTSYKDLTKQLRVLDDQLGFKRARLIARDQVGKLNGAMTQARMTEAGLELYEWSTSMDERVRGNPAGLYPRAIPSHYIMEGKTCRWDDPSVYRDASGQWVPREGAMPKAHPGEEIQCRCSALPIWDDLVKEVDDTQTLEQAQEALAASAPAKPEPVPAEVLAPPPPPPPPPVPLPPPLPVDPHEAAKEVIRKLGPAQSGGGKDITTLFPGLQGGLPGTPYTTVHGYGTLDDVLFNGSGPAELTASVKMQKLNLSSLIPSKGTYSDSEIRAGLVDVLDGVKLPAKYTPTAIVFEGKTYLYSGLRDALARIALKEAGQGTDELLMKVLNLDEALANKQKLLALAKAEADKAAKAAAAAAKQAEKKAKAAMAAAVKQYAEELAAGKAHKPSLYTHYLETIYAQPRAPYKRIPVKARPAPDWDSDDATYVRAFTPQLNWAKNVLNDTKLSKEVRELFLTGLKDVQSYRGSGSKNINAALRGLAQAESGTKRKIKYITAMVDNNRIEVETQLIRSAYFYRNLQVGSDATDLAFTSWATGDRPVSTFVDWARDARRDHAEDLGVSAANAPGVLGFFRLRARPGDPLMPLVSHDGYHTSLNTNEREVLGQRGLPLRVVSIRRNPVHQDFMDIEVEIYDPEVVKLPDAPTEPNIKLDHQPDSLHLDAKIPEGKERFVIGYGSSLAEREAAWAEITNQYLDGTMTPLLALRLGRDYNSGLSIPAGIAPQFLPGAVVPDPHGPIVG